MANNNYRMTTEASTGAQTSFRVSRVGDLSWRDRLARPSGKNDRRIGVDNDDTLRRCETHLKRRVEAGLGRTIPYHSLRDALKDSRDPEIVAILRELKHDPSFFAQLGLYRGTIGGSNLMYQHGLDLEIITALESDSASNIAKELQEIIHCITEIHQRPPGEDIVQFKLRIMRERAIRENIDDNPDVLFAGAEEGRRGRLVSRPWNRKFTNEWLRRNQFGGLIVRHSSFYTAAKAILMSSEYPLLRLKEREVQLTNPLLTHSEEGSEASRGYPKIITNLGERSISAN